MSGLIISEIATLSSSSDTVLILDNSAPESGVKRIIAKKDLGAQLSVEDKENWAMMQRGVNVGV